MAGCFTPFNPSFEFCWTTRAPLPDDWEHHAFICTNWRIGLFQARCLSTLLVHKQCFCRSLHNANLGEIVPPELLRNNHRVMTNDVNKEPCNAANCSGVGPAFPQSAGGHHSGLKTECDAQSQ